MKLTVLCVVLAVHGVLSLPAPESAQSRPGPPINPHEVDAHTIKQHEHTDPHKEPKLPSTRAFEENDLERQSCDKAGIIAASGDDLVRRVKAAESRCINSLFSLSGSDARQAFNYADMMSIANAFYSSTYFYDAKNPTKDNLLQLVLYLRAGLYVYFGTDDHQGIPTHDNQLFTYIEQGLKYFFDRPNLETQNDDHFNTFGETITLITNAHLTLKFVDQMSSLLTKIASTWSWTLLDYGSGTVVNWIFNVYWRWTFEKGANEFLAGKSQTYQAMDLFATRRANLKGTSGEWLLANSNSELARLMQFASLKPKVVPLVQAQMRKYSLTNGPRMWMAIANQVSFYDNENCAAYGACNYKETAKQTLLPYKKTCSTTYKDQFTIIAQQISTAQMEEVCNRLHAHEYYFHDHLKTSWQPVKDDNNWRLNVVIYASSDDYIAYNGALFGYDTNNGGIYIEGNPADPNNVGNFFCYVRPTYEGKWDVWNLEHEITHYFDGRYDTYGDFATMYEFPTVWWSEGLGEYMAHKNDYNMFSTVCTEKKYPLSSIFATVYEQGTEKVYYYGYAAVRFMFEKHPAEVARILGYFRVGKFEDYKTYLTKTLSTTYDSEFSNWCDQHKSG